jgi:formylglycine-generating enzyme required for sulfatase activity
MKRLSLLCLMLLFILSSVLQAEQRIALVIGNASYETSPLRNPINDARDMTAALKDLGFKVTTLIDASNKEMYQAIRGFGEELPRADVCLFYFAGHGMQIDGVNYLIPIGADIQAEEEIKFSAIDANLVLAKMERAGTGTNILLLDACRDNPFARSFRSSSRGLAVMDAPSGSLIVYATAPGSVAADGKGRNGVFTGAFLRHMKTPSVDVEYMLREVRREVMAETNGKQIPWSASSLILSFYFVGKSEVSVKKEEEERKPEGLVLVEAGTFQMGSESGDSDEKSVHSVTISRAYYMSKYEVTQKQWLEIMEENPSHFKGDNLPVHNVSWNSAIEYCNLLSTKQGLTPCYSDSSQNVRCDFSANGYRLPTEAEWEFAAHGGKKALGLRYSGSTGGDSVGDIGWYSSNSEGKIHEVGGKKPNELGLYDMSGNVWEWCWDWYGEYIASSQTDPAGPISGSYRVRRGGSWESNVKYLRSTLRNYSNPFAGAMNSTGLRLVRIAE